MSINKRNILLVLIYLQSIFPIYCGEHVETVSITSHILAELKRE